VEILFIRALDYKTLKYYEFTLSSMGHVKWFNCGQYVTSRWCHLPWAENCPLRFPKA